jgi:hypothetical protein
MSEKGQGDTFADREGIPPIGSELPTGATADPDAPITVGTGLAMDGTGDGLVTERRDR